MLNNSDVWLPSGRDDVCTADSSAGLVSHPDTPACCLLPKGAPMEEAGRAGLCSGNNRQQKLLGSLLLTRGTGMRSLRSSWPVGWLVGRAELC